MSFPIQPIYLLADSQPLFQRRDGDLLLREARDALDVDEPKAAYIGASNGDDPTFYGIFEAAMDQLGIRERRMIRADYPDEDAAWLQDAALILLAGGDVARGWQAIDGTGMRNDIITRYYAGAILVGVSAGAVQLGLGGARNEMPADEDDLLETFKLIPYYLDAHDEDARWARLKQTLTIAGENSKGLGIPKGGAALYHPGNVLEPYRFPLVEMVCEEEGVADNLLFPPEEEPEEPELM